MTREEAIAEIEAAGGKPSNSTWLKYSIPERPNFCRFPSKFYGDLAPGTLRREVEEARRTAPADHETEPYVNPLDGTRLWDNS